jgi:uncharacterized protein (TIGR02246 family)
MLNRTELMSALVALSALGGGCARKEPAAQAGGDRQAAAAVDTKAAEAEIRQGDKEFFDAVKARNANAIADQYAPDAISMPANSPPLMGRDAILRFNQQMLKTPGLTLTGETDVIKFSDDGTMAYAAGKYSASFTDPKGHAVKDEGKYLNVLRRVDGKWRLVADAFSSNKEPPR